MWEQHLDQPLRPLKEPDGGDWGFDYPIGFLLDFKGIWKASNCQMTLTGSYIGDLEQYPNFWDDIYRLVRVEAVQQEKIDRALKTLDGIETDSHAR